MSPTLAPTPRRLASHPQRPWRPVEVPERPSSRPAARHFAAATVRELPQRRDSAGAAW